MTPDEIKQINIREYLEQMNIHPVKNYGYYGMHHCPSREDRNASFKVDYNKNIWYDFGAGEGGTMIDLVMKMNNCSFHEAANRLEKKYADVHISNHADNLFSFHGDNSPTIIQNIIPITHPKLIAWVQERKIGLALANMYCKEIHYQNQSGQFFSIGFPNDKGGYELSSPPSFKSCISPKNITDKKGGRPKLSPAEKLKYRISVRLCTQDYYALKAKAAQAGMSCTEVARLAITGCQICQRLTPEQMDCIRKIAGMGNNLNQIAKRINIEGYTNNRTEYLYLADDIDKALTLLEDGSKDS